MQKDDDKRDQATRTDRFNLPRRHGGRNADQSAELLSYETRSTNNDCGMA